MNTFEKGKVNETDDENKKQNLRQKNNKKTK